MFRKVAFFSVAAALIGCNSNPYSGVDRTNTANSPNVQKVAQNYWLETPEKPVDIIEGTTLPIPLYGYPENGVISVRGLPAWAQFDPATKTIVCAPPVGAAFDDVDRSAHVHYYTAQVLYSLPGTAKIRQLLTMAVHKATPNVVVTGDFQDLQLTEGVDLQTNLTIASADFPHGPFTVMAENAPPGMKIEHNFGSGMDSSVFTIKYTPPVGTIDRTGNGNVTGDNSPAYTCPANQPCKHQLWSFVVVLPNGSAADVYVNWTIVLPANAVPATTPSRP